MPELADTTDPTEPEIPSARVRAAYRLLAVVAAGGFLLTALLSALGAYALEPPVGHTYGLHPSGLAGAFSRVADTVSYFTEWSNVVVALGAALVARTTSRPTLARRVLLLAALVMITVTAIVYALLLAPTAHVTGWSLLTNPWQHIVVPAATALLWLVAGPRRWFGWKVAAGALAIPVAWIGWMLARGAVIGAYPYAFVDVRTHGWGPVGKTLVSILAFGLVVTLLYVAIDAVATRIRRPKGLEPA